LWLSELYWHACTWPEETDYLLVPTGLICWLPVANWTNLDFVPSSCKYMHKWRRRRSFHKELFCCKPLIRNSN
jgi:hypothetical protein